MNFRNQQFEYRSIAKIDATTTRNCHSKTQSRKFCNGVPQIGLRNCRLMFVYFKLWYVFSYSIIPVTVKIFWQNINIVLRDDFVFPFDWSEVELREWIFSFPLISWSPVALTQTVLSSIRSTESQMLFNWEFFHNLNVNFVCVIL